MAIYLGNQLVGAAALGNLPVSQIANQFVTPTTIPTEDLVFWLSGENYAGSGDWLSYTGSLDVTGSFFGSPTYNSTTKTFEFTEVDGMTTGPTGLDYLSGSNHTVILAARWTGTASDKHGRILVSGYPAPSANISSVTYNWTLGMFSGSYVGNESSGPAYRANQLGLVNNLSGSYDTNWRIFTGAGFSDSFAGIGTFYVNGTYIAQESAVSPYYRVGFYGLGINSGSYQDGPTASNLYENSNCEVGDIILYNRRLEQDEVTTVYNAIKGRYGL